MKKIVFLVLACLGFQVQSVSANPPGPPPLTNDGCHFEYSMYGNNGEVAPPGSYYRYCVCESQPANDPLSWHVPEWGGWTYPSTYCRTDYSTY